MFAFCCSGTSILNNTDYAIKTGNLISGIGI